MNYIALLRGINVGNRHKILMADLKELFVHLGFLNVRTYIQTGNVIFSSSSKVNRQDLAEKIEKEIQKKFGFDVPVIIKEAEELSNISINNPFVKEGIVDVNRLHLTFLEKKPDDVDIENILKLSNISKDDRFIISNEVVYLYCSGKYHETKFGNNFFEKKLNVKASTRNWKTVIKLSEMSLL